MEKVALARGLMRIGPGLRLLVMDEPTAALDAETEHQMVAAMASGSATASADGGITFIASHRLSTARYGL